MNGSRKSLFVSHCQCEVVCDGEHSVGDMILAALYDKQFLRSCALNTPAQMHSRTYIKHLYMYAVYVYNMHINFAVSVQGWCTNTSQQKATNIPNGHAFSLESGWKQRFDRHLKNAFQFLANSSFINSLKLSNTQMQRIVDGASQPLHFCKWQFQRFKLSKMDGSGTNKSAFRSTWIRVLPGAGQWPKGVWWIDQGVLIYIRHM